VGVQDVNGVDILMLGRILTVAFKKLGRKEKMASIEAGELFRD